MRTPRRLIVLVVGAAVLLTGCLKLDVGLEVNDDGSGTLRMISAVDVQKLEELAEMFGEDAATEGEPSIREQVEDIDPSELPPGASVTYYEDGRFQGVEVVVAFTAEDDLGQLIGEALAASPGDAGDLGSGPTAGMFESFLVEPDGAGGWRFEATMASTDELADEGGMPPEMLRNLIGEPEVQFSIRLPGRQVEHNADRLLGDGTMVWDLDLFGGTGEQALAARTVPGSPITGSDDGGLSPVVVGLVAIGVLLGAVAVVLFIRNGRAGAAPPATPTAPAA